MTTLPIASTAETAAAVPDTCSLEAPHATIPAQARRPIDLKVEAAQLKENMTFGEIDGIKHPVLRAMALMSTCHLEPRTAYWRNLIKSVDVPEAGDWGRQAQALLDQKLSAGSAKKQSSSSGSLFLSFAEDLAVQVDAELRRKSAATLTAIKVEG